MNSCYVYYRVDECAEAKARIAVEAILARMRRDTGIQGRWMRKVSEPLLWMEIYEGIDDTEGFFLALERAVIEAGFQRLLIANTTRKQEHFVSCA